MKLNRKVIVYLSIIAFFVLGCNLFASAMILDNNGIERDLRTLERGIDKYLQNEDHKLESLDESDEIRQRVDHENYSRIGSYVGILSFMGLLYLEILRKRDEKTARD